MTSDNGGQAKWQNAAGANMPLRGGKYSPWEGGVRV
jgi:arylsulfatase A-like enzyme